MVDMDSDTFNKYLRRMKTDEKAFRKIYKYYLPKIKYRVISKYGNSVDFEDVAHDVFTRLFRYDNYPFVENPTSWIYKICDNTVMDDLRKYRNETPLNDGMLSVQSSENLSEAEGDANFFGVLRNLDGESAEIVKLVFWDGYNLKEISAILGINYGTVRQKYSRALKKLRGILKNGKEC